MVPIPPAFDTAAANGPPDVRAMPASMMGYLIPSSLVSGVFRGGGDDDDDDDDILTGANTSVTQGQKMPRSTAMKGVPVEVHKVGGTSRTSIFVSVRVNNRKVWGRHLDPRIPRTNRGCSETAESH